MRHRRNPFLARPEKFRGPQTFGTRSHPGFHTCREPGLAVPYAQFKGGDIALPVWFRVLRDYPVIVGLDMRGFKAVLDFDAVKTSMPYLVDAAREAVRRAAWPDERLDVLEEMAEEERDPAIPLHQVRNVVTALFLVFCQRIDDPVRGLAAFVRGLDDPGRFIGELAEHRISDEDLMEIVGQYRYLDDVPEDRVVSVDYMTPFWHEVLDPDARGARERIAQLRSEGWSVVTPESLFEDRVPLRLARTWSQPVAGARIEYHGTSYRNLLEAAPHLRGALPVPPRPFLSPGERHPENLRDLED